MGIRRIALATLASAGLLLSAACSPPERRFTEEQLKQVTVLKDLMDFMATEADPGFALAKGATPATVTPEQVARLGEIGRTLRPAAARIAEPALSKGPDFNKRAAEIGERLAALEAAAASKDGAKTLQATQRVKESCAACHTAFR
jgi:cytochrome c556